MGSSDADAPATAAGELGAIASQVGKIAPNAVARLLADLKMLVAYESAADWDEGEAMQRAFEAFSWDDTNVQRALTKYVNITTTNDNGMNHSSSGADINNSSSEIMARSRVEYAYNALCPRPIDPRDPNRLMMGMWLKARLYYYDSQYPFQLNPYGRGVAS
eukprot:Filipodium_phascolosomae@DN6918_c0_g1_i1.p1